MKNFNSSVVTWSVFAVRNLKVETISGLSWSHYFVEKESYLWKVIPKRELNVGILQCRRLYCGNCSDRALSDEWNNTWKMSGIVP